jgi:hypothetical protein
MGTRGAIGFFINGKEKVTYNHFDSYPSSLGNDLMEFLKECDLNKLKEAAENIILVKSDSIPTAQQIKECENFLNLNVSEQSETDWYCLLRETQGTLKPYYENNLKYMIDNQNFLYDSLFCEWAYIVNFDSNMLEIYKGFNKNSKAEGRYANKREDKNKEYFGVELLSSIKLDLMKKLNITKIIEGLESTDEE